MTVTEFPTQIVEITYTRALIDGDPWMVAVAEPDGQRWEVSMRLHDTDPGGAAARKNLGLRIMTGIQHLTARPCGTKNCDRTASSHGDVRLAGPGKDLDVRHVHVCEPCKNAITSAAFDGPMSVLLMPYYAFTEYDA